MKIFYLLIGVSLLVALVFLAAFVWSVKNGQFEDNETPSMRVLFDDDSIEEKDEEEIKNKKEKSN